MQSKNIFIENHHNKCENEKKRGGKREQSGVRNKNLEFMSQNVKVRI
jgi:hypothetical protein